MSNGIVCIVILIILLNYYSDDSFVRYMSHGIVCVVILTMVLMYYRDDTHVIYLTYVQFCNEIDYNYFKNLSDEDLYHRACDNSSNYINKYQLAYSIISDDEKISLERDIAYCQKLLPRYMRIPWKIVKLSSDITVEGGYPHTMGNVIVLRDKYFNDTKENQRSLLIHEYIHLYQKAKPVHSEKLIRSLGFFKSTEQMPFAANPDLNRYNYYYVDHGTKYLIGSIYDNNAPKHSLTFLDIKINMDKPGPYSIVNLNSELYQQGHPYEIMAELISRVLIGHRYVRPDWRDLILQWL